MCKHGPFFPLSIPEISFPITTSQTSKILSMLNFHYFLFFPISVDFFFVVVVVRFWCIQISLTAFLAFFYIFHIFSLFFEIKKKESPGKCENNNHHCFRFGSCCNIPIFNFPITDKAYGKYGDAKRCNLWEGNLLKLFEFNFKFKKFLLIEFVFFFLKNSKLFHLLFIVCSFINFFWYFLMIIQWEYLRVFKY